MAEVRIDAGPRIGAHASAAKVLPYHGGCLRMATVDPQRWRALSPYLDEALDLSPESRVAWLADLGERDAALATDLRLLLAEHAEVDAEGYLERGVAATLKPAAASSLAGQVVGAYRLVSPLGQGGMGSVWLAERNDGRFAGRAAVKLLNVALVGRAVEGRFRREGTILARVTHPNIAHLIDAGVTPAGQPYLVLELVEGQHLDKYCAERRLSVDGRLTLFLDVLSAVAHAHANLIVHRDIKPTNVLVTSAGHVKLLDFGIAKLVSEETQWTGEAAETSALTRDAGVAMTPEFAAPEQLTEGQVTTATDVYALGLLLYVLLTGRHPAGDALKSPARLVRAIVDDEPPRMSDLVAEPTAGESNAAEAFATQCGTTVARLRRQLRGDLDTIVARALKKAPGERYASVVAMADDIRRYLDREPIAARPDTLRYRLAKFVGRHTQGVAASVAVVGVLVGLVAFYTTRLASERDRAQREATKAEKVSQALTGLLLGADPIANRATGEALTVRGLIDAGADKARTGLADQPEAQAEILTVLGRLYRLFGAFERSQDLLQQALVSGERAFGDEDVRIAQTLNELGSVLAQKGDYVAAADRLERALALRRRLFGNEHADVAVTLVELARLYEDRGMLDRAEPLHREALGIRQRVLGVGDRETAVSLNGLGSILRLNGDLDGAEAMIREGLEVNRRTRGDAHANTGSTLHDLGLIAFARGNLREAESLFQQALDIHAKALGDVHPNIAIALNSLAHVWVAQGKLEQARTALARAIGIGKQALGAENQLVAIYTLNLADVDLARHDAVAAEALARDGLRIRALAPDVTPGRRRLLAADDWPLGRAKTLLGATMLAQRHYDEAETLLIDGRRDLEALPARPDAALQANAARLADLYVAWGKPERAAGFRPLMTRASAP